jgi:hypothetical protein
LGRVIAITGKKDSKVREERIEKKPLWISFISIGAFFEGCC